MGYTGYINASGPGIGWHINHCLFALEVVVKCKADISPVILEETPELRGLDEELPLSSWRLRDPVKKCRKYEPLRDWFRDHAICSSYCNADEIYS
jgi:hypothetical protein